MSKTLLCLAAFCVANSALAAPWAGADADAPVGQVAPAVVVTVTVTRAALHTVFVTQFGDLSQAAMQQQMNGIVDMLANSASTADLWHNLIMGSLAFAFAGIVGFAAIMGVRTIYDIEKKIHKRIEERVEIIVGEKVNNALAAYEKGFASLDSSEKKKRAIAAGESTLESLDSHAQYSNHSD